MEWELRTASITDAKGNTIFEQRNVESPKDWSMTAINIVASKYLHGTLGTPQRETGVRQLIQRVAETIRDWGWQQGYFSTAEDRDTFHDELVHILVQQKAAFNSPVWFNVGCDRLEPLSDAQNWHWNIEKGTVEFSTTGYKAPQCSACFINSVKRFAGLHPDAGQDRRHAVQVGQRHGHQSFRAARIDRRTFRRRTGLRPAQLHERL